MSGKDLKNLDTVGKSDPYARINLSGVQKRRTPTWKNNLNPEWDEVFYIPIHNAREKLTLEVMDEENVGSDRSMGKVDLAASDYVEQGDDGEYLVHDSKNEVQSRQLRIGNASPKGTIYFTAAFYPTIPTIDPEDEDDEEDAKGKASMDGVARSVASNGQIGRERSNTAGTVSTIATTASKAGEREMQKALAAGEKEQVEAEEVQTKVVPKIRVTAEDLNKYGMFHTSRYSECPLTSHRIWNSCLQDHRGRVRPPRLLPRGCHGRPSVPCIHLRQDSLSPSRLQRDERRNDPRAGLVTDHFASGV